MKTPTCSLLVPAVLFLGLPLVGFGQVSWDAGGVADKNWSTTTNWNPDGSPAATAVTFGATGVTANATTVGNIVDSSYTSTNSLTSLTYNANSTSWQVTQIASGQTLTDAGVFLVGGLSGANQVTKTAFTGTGSLVINNGASAVTIGNSGATTANAILDMSALSTFTATASSFNVGTGTTGFGTVYLADNSTITATTISSGGGGASYGSAVSNKIFLGTTTVLNTNTLSLAGNRTYGTVKFRAVGDGAANNTTVVSPTLTIRAADGTSAAAMSVGAWAGASPSNGTSSVDLTGGTVDAKVTTLKVGTTSANSSNTMNASLTIDGSASTFDASGLVTVGENTGGTSGTLGGTLNIKGGATFTANAMTLGNQTAGATATKGTLTVSGANTSVTVTNNLTMGVRSGTATVTPTITISDGTLTVGGNLAEGTGAASIVSTVNLSGGTLDMTRGNVAVDTFAFTGGTLKNVASFTGNLNAQNSATLGFDNIDGSFTATTLVGALTLGASSNLSLSLANGFTPTTGFLLVDNDTTLDSISGTFATVNGGAFGSGNTFTLTNNTGTYNFALSYAGGDGNDLSLALVSIPEPSTYAMLAGVLALGMGVWRRTRGRSV